MGLVKSGLRTALWLAGVLFGLAAVRAGAQAGTAGAVQTQAVQETASVAFRDIRGTSVTMRIPLALNRPANYFRLYGLRPLTLHDPGRRRDLYRDAFLEMATGSLLQPRVDIWAPADQQLQWIGQFVWRQTSRPPSLQGIGPVWERLRNPGGLARDGASWVREMTRTPLPAHAAALVRAFGDDPPGAAGPVLEALAFRALATDEAEARLRTAGLALGLDQAAPGIGSRDPALREGYRAARAEFDQVRQGLWPGIAAAMRRRQGSLVMDAIKPLALSSLGGWALFGYLGWQAAESALNVEYRGQSALCLATLAVALRNAEQGPSVTADREAVRHLALRAEYGLNHQLTQALKREQVLAFQPAGGRREADWQISLAARSAALRSTLVPEK